jgi:outer membrane protein TolC
MGRPQVSLLGGFDVARPNRRILPPRDRFDDSWDVGVEVRYTLADGGRRRASVEGAEARVEVLRHRLEGLEEGLRLEVTSRLLDLDTAGQAQLVTGQALASAEESVKVASDRFREGLIPSSELLDQETALLRAGLDHTESRVALRLARARLDRALGR